MRKGRFTKQEIRRAIATNSLGVRAFFTLLLKVIIADNRLSYKYNKEIRLKYLSFENRAYTNEWGILSVPRGDKQAKQNLKKLKKELNEIFYFKEKTDKKVCISLFLELTFTYIKMMNEILNLNPNYKLKYKANYIKSRISKSTSFFEFENLGKNEKVEDYIIQYTRSYYRSLELLRKKAHKKSIYFHRDSKQIIKSLFNNFCNPDAVESPYIILSSYYLGNANSKLEIMYYQFLEKNNLIFYLKQKYQIINIYMPKHNGRTLLLRMIESIIDSLNMNLKYSFNHNFLKELKPDFNFYKEINEILSQSNIIKRFKLNKVFEDELKELDFTFDDCISREAAPIYIPVLIEITKENYSTLPIDICINAMHYLYTISVLSRDKYKKALEDLIILYNREFYLCHDSKANSAKFFESQAHKRDEMLSKILHKYLGFNTIRIIALLDQVSDFNSLDEEKLSKSLNNIFIPCIGISIIKFKDDYGSSVKFDLSKYIEMKNQQELEDTGAYFFYNFSSSDVEKKELESNSIEKEVFRELGNDKYESLRKVEFYHYNKNILFTAQTTPIITKYEINEFYEDLLGIDGIIASINNIIATNQKTKFLGGYAIGVFGHFGSGKSSIINLLFSLLSSKNRLNPDDIYTERVFRISLSEYSSESIVEEVYFQLEKKIIQELSSTTVRYKGIKQCFKEKRLEKRKIQNSNYKKIIEKYCNNDTQDENNILKDLLDSFEPKSKQSIYKCFIDELKNTSNKSEIIKEKRKEVKEIRKKIKEIRKEIKTCKHSCKIEYYNFKRKYNKTMRWETISKPTSSYKQKKLKDKVNKYVYSSYTIQSTTEMERIREIRRGKNWYLFLTSIFGILSVVLWISFFLWYYLDILNRFFDFSEGFINFLPLLASIPTFLTSYFLYRGVSRRDTTSLAENKIAVNHIEKLLEFSKKELYKNKKSYKKMKKEDKTFSTYPINTIIMIDNLDRVSNERIGNVLQGIAFINNEITNNNITFIIPISYEKVSNYPSFINDNYTVSSEFQVTHTYRNANPSTAVVLDNSYLNKILDYKVFLPTLTKNGMKRFIFYALNKAVERKFILLNADGIVQYFKFIVNYFWDRNTKNLRDIANILNDVFSYHYLCSQIFDTKILNKVLHLLFIFCDIRYQFLDLLEELLYEKKFLYHFKKIIEFGINEDIFYESYSENLKRKLNDELEGRKYKEFLSIAYEILESPKSDYMNIIDQVFDVFLQKVKTKSSNDEE